MKLNFKNVFLSVGIFVFALAMFGLGSSKAEAATCTASAGDWMTPGIWSCARVPLAGDDVVIPTNVAVTLGAAGAVANTISFDPAAANSSITMSGATTTLNVTGAITIPATTSAGVVSQLVVADGTLTAGGVITITGSVTDNEDSILSATTGTINANGGITFAGTAAEAQLTIGAGRLNIGGTTGILGAGGTVTLDPASTTTFSGTGTQVIEPHTYGILTINKTGSATMQGTINVLGALNITAGTLDTAQVTLAVTGITTVSSGATMLVSHTGGSKAFNGNVIVAGTLTESAAEILTFGGNLTINSGGTMTEYTTAIVTVAGDFTVNGTYTASTGLHTFSKSAGVISGSTTISIGSVRIADNTTNSGTLTVATLLEVSDGKTLTNTGTVTATTALSDVGGATGTFLNSTNGTLNIGDVIDISALTATAAGNTVNYTKDGDQTAFDTNYINLGLSSVAAHAKTIPATMATISGNLVLGGLAKITLSDSGVTANKLYFGTAYQRSGTWSASTSGTGANKSDTYFTSGVTYYITVTLGSSSGNRSVSETLTYTPTNTTPLTTTTETTTTEVANGCSGGNLFNTSTGAACVNNAVVPQGCSGGNLFNTSTGKPCSNNTEVTSKKVYALGQTTLKNGSKGEAVKELQRFLNDKLSLGLVVDGKLGPKTIAVIKTWQTANGLVSDGLVGAKTKALMNK